MLFLCSLTLHNLHWNHRRGRFNVLGLRCPLGPPLNSWSFLGPIQLVNGAALMTGSRCWGGWLKAESWHGWYHAHLLTIAAEFTLTVSRCQGAKKWDVTSLRDAELPTSVRRLPGIFLRNDSQQAAQGSEPDAWEARALRECAPNFLSPSVQTVASGSTWALGLHALIFKNVTVTFRPCHFSTSTVVHGTRLGVSLVESWGEGLGNLSSCSPESQHRAESWSSSDCSGIARPQSARKTNLICVYNLFWQPWTPGKQFFPTLGCGINKTKNILVYGKKTTIILCCLTVLSLNAHTTPQLVALIPRLTLQNLWHSDVKSSCQSSRTLFNWTHF